MSKNHKMRTKRLNNPLACRLSEPEQVEIMLKPRLHLDCVLHGETHEPLHLASIVGVINVAMALAYLHKDKYSINLYESVQQTLVDIARRGIANDEESRRLQRVFNIADDYIVSQAKADVLRAINLVEYQIRHGEGNSLLPLPPRQD